MFELYTVYPKSNTKGWSICHYSKKNGQEPYFLEIKDNESYAKNENGIRKQTIQMSCIGWIRIKSTELKSSSGSIDNSHEARGLEAMGWT